MTAPTFERGEGGTWIRNHPGEWTSGGHPLVVHVAAGDDLTPCHRTYPTGYDSRCGWCYLGANHSAAEHARKLADARNVELAELLRQDLAGMMPGCRIAPRPVTGGWVAEAQHRVTGRRMTLRVVGREWSVSTGPGNMTTGSSAYGFDSAVDHGYRHVLDFDGEHGPGTAWEYAQREQVTA